MSNLTTAQNLVAQLNQLLVDTGDNVKMGITIEAADILFDVLMQAKSKADRQHAAAMIEERAARNVIAQAKIAAENGE